MQCLMDHIVLNVEDDERNPLSLHKEDGQLPS